MTGLLATFSQCLTEDHDLRIVAVAAAICAIGLHSSLAIGSNVARAPAGRVRRAWIAAGILATACAIWATHFIAMLAHRPGAVVGFQVPETLASLAVAILLVTLGGLIQARNQGPRGRTLGAAVIGLAIAALHYTGMAGYDVPGALHWDPAFVALSVASGVLLTIAAVQATWSRRRWLRWSAGSLFTLAVALTHFLGMAGVRIVPDPLRQLHPMSVSPDHLLLPIVGVSLLLVLLALFAVILSWRAWKQRLAERERLRDFADVAVEGLLICECEEIVGANRSLCRMLGATRAELLGQPVAAILGRAAADVPDALEADSTVSGGDGTTIPVRLIAQDIAIGNRAHRVIAVRDQRERLKAEAEILRLAHDDPLTGLPNRRSFGLALGERLAQRSRRIDPFALLMVDLDRFKNVNDTLGHGVGDELLCRVAARFRRALRDGDLIARLGGDEFAVIASLSAPADAEALAQRLVDFAARPFLISGHVLEVGASVGIALAPQDGRTPELLAQSADVALYAAKEAGRGTWRLFETEMNTRRQDRRALELDLRRAVARGEFVVHYQPQVDSVTRRFTGAEALLRWPHERRGMVPPAVFVPLAEELGLIGDIGEWVLKTACRDALEWPESIRVAVNLSPVQLRDPALGQTIAGILAETGLPPARLELEITETALLQDDGTTFATLGALRALGIRISMDDFGTGYSSLSYLSRFPFDKIKIDKSFIQQAESDRNSASIVRAITTLGCRLGMSVTAEGVETEAQRQFMAREGADQLQGFLFSKPVPAESVRSLFRSAEREPA